MGIDHRGLDIFVAEEFLDRPDVVAVLPGTRHFPDNPLDGPILTEKTLGLNPRMGAVRGAGGAFPRLGPGPGLKE